MANSARIINIGIPKTDRAQIADGLARVLADTNGSYKKPAAEPVGAIE
jgi:hypothetical protein